MRNFLLTITIAFAASYSYAQVPIGYYYDINGQPIEGYLDVLEYSPLQELKINYTSNSYEKGYYYDLNGDKVNGHIKLKNSKILYKQSASSTPKRLKVEDTKAFVVGVDSFFITKNFKIERRTGALSITRSGFMQYITSFNGYTFAKHYYFPSQSSIIKTFQVKKEGDQKWVSFPVRRKDFIEVALEYFGHIPYLKTKIRNKELSYEDMMTLIKMAEYYDKYNKGERVYYDKRWQEVRTKGLVFYEAEIVSKEDSIWTLNYFQNEKKVFTIQYSSFYPNRKNGLFTAYYNDGGVRKTIEYKNDEPVTTSVFFENGKKHHMYDREEVRTPDGFDVMDVNIYKDVRDTLGEKISTGKPSYTECFDDKISNRMISNKFKLGRLLDSYYTLDGQKIHRLCDQSYIFKMGALQNKLNTHLSNKQYDRAIEDNAQGKILIAFVVNEKGYTKSYKVLNKLHPEIDGLIRTFLLSYFSPNATYKYRFKRYKINKEKVPFEVVVPVSFSIKKFYREPANYYYDPHLMNMMHQQIMMQSVGPY